MKRHITRSHLPALLLTGLILLLTTTGCGPAKGFEDLKSTRECDCGLPQKSIKGVLLTTRFKSFRELKSEVNIEYFNDSTSSGAEDPGENLVRISHCSDGKEVVSLLRTGVSEKDFSNAKEGGLWERLDLLFTSPFAVMNKNNLQRVYLLSRRRSMIFGEGDVAFYDLAETMMCHMDAEDLDSMPAADRTEKGYINTFNHVTAQAFMTTLFSEDVADLVADAHERKHMPELISGTFTPDQILDIENGPVDNYVDMINNEWGQELGKKFKEKYHIQRDTEWTPELMANYLNDMQGYFSWALQVGFEPYTPQDEVVVKFAAKINRVMGDLSKVQSNN